MMTWPVLLLLMGGRVLGRVPFIMAMDYGASACFLVPYGYQIHLMIYSPCCNSWSSPIPCRDYSGMSCPETMSAMPSRPIPAARPRSHPLHATPTP